MLKYMSGIIGLAVTLSSSLSSAAVIYVEREAPPEVIVEHPAPRHGYVWVGGHHIYRGHRYVWHRGHYARERRGWTWRDGAWERRDNGYVWHDGGWRR